MRPANAGEGSGRDLARLLARAERITVLTGAGLSTECGVPDFRSPDSPWRVHVPIDFQAFLGGEAARAEAWRRKFAMDDIYAGAKPGRGHRALVELASDGRLAAVITQNIDGLQQAAGLSPDKLIELHGNGTFARCLSCGSRHELRNIRVAFVRTGRVPPCACGGLVKSASIAFGQPLDPGSLGRARAAALACDVCLVLGSSLLVRPAVRFPEIAKANGAALAIVNREPTPLDGRADLVVHDDIGNVLSLL